MIQELENEQIVLKDCADKHSIYELSSEEIIKLSRVNSIGLIAQCFGITSKEFMDVRKNWGLTNIYLEDSIRNIEVILYYFDSGNKYFSNKIRNKILDILIYSFGKVPPKNKFYLTELSKFDFSRQNIKRDLEFKKVNINGRLKENNAFILHNEKLMQAFIEEEKKYLIHDNDKEMYNKLCEDMEKGGSFTKDELTYDVLFELSVIENVPDSLIGNIYQMSKSQIRYLRTKFGFSNLHKTKMLTYPETIIYYMEEHNQRPEGMSNEECEKVVNQLLENLYGKKDSNSGVDVDLDNEVTIDIGDEKVTYRVNFSEEKYSVDSKTTRSRKSNGSRRNHRIENETKRLHGKIGERLALEAEKMRLTRMGLGDLVNEVRLVAQIDEDTTLDGLGYDLISFNELGERVCIEVKTSYGKKDKPFFISQKEIDLIQGLKVEYACKECFIYYVLIDENNVTIKNIQPYDFNLLKLTPVLYKVG